MAHNPEVAGSNPAPATRSKARSIRSGPFAQAPVNGAVVDASSWPLACSTHAERLTASLEAAELPSDGFWSYF